MSDSSELKVAIRDERNEFRPGDVVEGVAGWNLKEQPERVEVRLFWYTRGKGSQNVEVVWTEVFDQPQQSEARPFSITLPEGPYSFSGGLITLVWALEVVALPAEESTRAEFTMSSTGKEVVLN